MKRICLAILLILSPSITAQNRNTNSYFTKNNGQWDKQILYKADFRQGKAVITQNSLRIIVLDSMNRYFHPHNPFIKCNDMEKYCVFSISPYNSNIASSSITTAGQTKWYSNYFIGNDKSKYAAHVKSFSDIIYNDVYEGVDWKICFYGSTPKHYYIVKPKADTKQIRTIYKGADSVYIDEGKLYIETKQGLIIEDSLLVYQTDNRQKIKKIPAFYTITKQDDNYIIGYDIEEYNNQKDLIIDPGLVFSTYSGSHADNWGMTSCYDKSNLMISGGIAKGFDFAITEGAYDVSYNGDWDVVVTKYDDLGQNMIFSTYLGGNLAEMPHSMVINESNEIVVFGTTGSEDFPTTETAYQRMFQGGDSIGYDGTLNYRNGVDIFISTLSSEGDALISSTYLGGSKNDGFNFKAYIDQDYRYLYNGNDSLYANYGDCARGEVVCDKNNNIYVATCTFSNDFPTTPNAYKTTSNGRQDAIVFKLDHSLSNLIYSTYLGGGYDDAAYSIELNKQNNAYVCGGTTSTDFPVTEDAYNISFNGGSTDAFISVISNDGTKLLNSTFFGSNKYDQAFIIRLDKADYPYIFGQTLAEGTALVHNVDYYTPSSGQFVAKFSHDLSSLEYSTVWGTGDTMINLSPSGFAVDVCGRIYCAGWGRIFKYMLSVTNMPHLGTIGLPTTPDAYMDTTDGMDFYIMSMDTSISQIDYATFFGEYSTESVQGNDHVDGGTSRFDKFGAFYLTVCASCSGTNNFPTTFNAHSTTNNSNNCNMASAKFQINDDFAAADFKCKKATCSLNDLAFINNSRADSFLWDFGDNSERSTQENPTHTFAKSGIYNVMLIAGLSNGCKLYDTTYKQLLVLSDTSYYLDTIKVCAGEKINIGLDGFTYTNDDSVSFDWQPMENISETHSANPYAIVYEPTLFRLIVSTNNCSDTLYRYVKIDKLKIDSLVTKNEGCKEEKQGSARVYLENESKVHYLWSCSEKDTDQLQNLSQGTYSINIQDANGCSIDTSFSINASDRYDILQTHKDITCWELCNAQITITPQGGTPPYQYIWNTQSTDSIIDNLCPGIYTLNVIDNNNCQVNKSYTVQDFAINANLNAAVDNDHIYDGQQIHLSSNYIDGFSYLWTPGNDLDNPTNYQTDGKAYENTTFIVTATNEDNCSISDSVQVWVKYVNCGKPNIFVANAFTPNNDGKNDLIKVEGEYISKIDFRIYNRWGENVFSSNSVSDYWDGKFRDKVCPAGVYYYKLEIDCIGGKKYITSGDITLIR